MKPIPQEEAMGCGIACVASICELSYKKAKRISFTVLEMIEAAIIAEI